MRQTRCAKNGHGRSSEGSSVARMAGRRRGSPMADHLRPRRGARGGVGASPSSCGVRAREGRVRRRTEGRGSRSGVLRRARPQLWREIPRERELLTAYRGEHEVREEEAELRARWRVQRRARTAGRAGSGEARRAVARAGVRCGYYCCWASERVEREVRRSAARPGR